MIALNNDRVTDDEDLFIVLHNLQVKKDIFI